MKTLRDFEDMKFPQWMLKQEAIKHVKFLRKEDAKLEGEDYGNQFNEFMNFFNITEEDLQ